MLRLVHVNVLPKDERWKWLMGKNVLQSFSQRVTAVFQYLDKEDLGFFSLTDMNEKGGEVFDYLSINLDHTSFGFMDTFRKIDVDGSGEIDEDEFAVGIIELLRTFKNNQSLLEEIANDVMPLGNISWDELQLILESNHEGAEQVQMQMLNKHFGAMLYIFEDKVNANTARPDTDVIDVEGFVEVMRQCVDEVIVDLRRHFHLPRKSKLDFAKSTKEIDIVTALERFKMAPAVWDVQSLADSKRVTIGGRRSKRSKLLNSLKKNEEESKAATLIPAHGEVVRHVKSLGVDPFDERIVESIDGDHMRLIQSLVKSIGHFIDLLAGRTSDVEALSILLMADGNLDQNSRNSVATIMTMERMLGKLTLRENVMLGGANSVVSGGGDGDGHVQGYSRIQDRVQNELMQKLLEVQEKILYKDVRLKLLELMQSHTMAQASDPDSLLDVDDSDPKFYSVEAITNEMRLVKAAISKGGYDDSLLSLLLEEEYAIVPVGEEEEREAKVGGNKGSGTDNGDVDDESRSSVTEKRDSDDDSEEEDNFETGDPCEWTMTKMLSNIKSIVKKVQHMGSFDKNMSGDDKNWRIDVITRNYAAEMAQLTQLREEVEHERNDMMHYQVEMQMLRDKGQRVDESEHAVIQMKSKNLELQRKLFEIEQQLKESQQARQAAENKAEALKPYELETTLKRVERELREAEHQRNKLARENKRLVLSTKQNEERLSTALQENVSLRSELNGYKDDLTASTVFLTAMQKKVEQERILRSDREELAKELRDTKRLLALKDSDLAESSEEGKLARKFKSELEATEDRNRELRDRVRMLEAENDRGFHAMEQMDEYRRVLREKETEVRDLQIRIYKQEATIQELKYSESRFAAMEEEIAMYKNKVEKIPALVSEVARLRGSSRATTKALDDQDRQLNEYKKTSNSLDRENSRLKSDLRRYADNEQKLADAQEHMGKIKAYISTSYKDTPVVRSTASTSGADVERQASAYTPSAGLAIADLGTGTAKSTPGDYKKVRRMLRQSIVANSGVVRPALSKSIEAAIESAMSPNAK